MSAVCCSARLPVGELQVAKRPEFQGKRIVTVGCSSTERYLSTLLAEKVREEVTNLPVAEI